MDSRTKRRAIIASIVTASVLLVATIGTTAFFVIRHQQRTDDIAQASRVATTFNKKVSTYRSAVQSALTSSDSDDAKKVKAAFDAAVVKTPKLGDAPEWGKTHSKSYLKAEKSEKVLKKPYENVSEVLDEAVIGQPFIKAAQTALDFEIDDFVGKANTFYNGSAFRNKLVPGMEKLLATFDKVKVPEGREQVASKVRTVLKAVIKDAKKAANDLDAGRNTSVDAQSEYLAATTAVMSYKSSLRSRLESAIEKAGAEASGQSKSESSA